MIFILIPYCTFAMCANGVLQEINTSYTDLMAMSNIRDEMAKAYYQALASNGKTDKIYQELIKYHDRIALSYKYNPKNILDRRVAQIVYMNVFNGIDSYPQYRYNNKHILSMVFRHIPVYTCKRSDNDQANRTT